MAGGICTSAAGDAPCMAEGVCDGATTGVCEGAGTCEGTDVEDEAVAAVDCAALADSSGAREGTPLDGACEGMGFGIAGDEALTPSVFGLEVGLPDSELVRADTEGSLRFAGGP